MLLELLPDAFFFKFTPQELSSFLMRVNSNFLYFLLKSLLSYRLSSSVRMWSTFFQQKVLLAEYKRNIGVKGGGRTVLWSRYFHQILALIMSILLYSNSPFRVSHLKNFHWTSASLKILW